MCKGTSKSSIRQENAFFSFRNDHTYMEMVSQSIGQILRGYEDANDCNKLRGDSPLKMSVGRKPSDSDLSSKSTMTRLENSVDSKTLYKIGKPFLDEYISSFEKAPKKVIIEGDDTNANTYGAQQLSKGFSKWISQYVLSRVGL